MDTESQTRLLDKRLSPSTRVAILNRDLRYQEQGIRMLLDAYRSGLDDEAGDVACDSATYSLLSNELLFELVCTCKRQLRTRALRMLTDDCRSRVFRVESCAEFICEYFKWNLPLTPLYTALDSKISLENSTFQRRISILAILFNNPRNRDLIFENKIKAEKLLIHMSRHLLKLYSNRDYRVDPDCDGVSWFFHLNPTGSQLRRYFPYIRAMIEPKRYIVANGIRRDMVTRGLWADYMDEYIELFDIHISSRPHLVANTMHEFIRDPQNVHRIAIDDEVLAKLDRLEKQYQGRTDDSLRSLYQKPTLAPALRHIDTSSTDFNGKTLKEWLRIIFLWSKDGGHLPILEQELQDMNRMCASGHFRRLINVTNGIMFTLGESINDARRVEFASMVQALIQAQPNCDDILADFPAKAIKYANMVTEEMLSRDVPVERWDEILTIRYMYLFPN